VKKPAVVKVPDWEPKDKSLLGKALDIVGLGKNGEE